MCVCVGVGALVRVRRTVVTVRTLATADDEETTAEVQAGR